MMECLATIGPWERIVVWISAAAGIIALIVALWWLDRSDNEFQLKHLVMEGDPPRASLNKLTIIVFSALAVWVIVMAVLENRIDPNVSALLLGVLGIFIIGRVGNQAVDRFSLRRPAPQIEVEQAENVNFERPPARPKRDSVIR